MMNMHKRASLCSDRLKVERLTRRTVHILPVDRSTWRTWTDGHPS